VVALYVRAFRIRYQVGARTFEDVFQEGIGLEATR